MSSDRLGNTDEGNVPTKVRTRVIEMEPGWLLVKFDGPKPSPHHRPHLLRQTLDDWRARHGGRKVTRIEPVQNDGQLIGLMAWTFLPNPKPLRVHRDVNTPKEHLEALLEHAYRLYFRDTSGEESIMVVNRANMAVVFDSHRVSVAPVEKVPVEERTKAEIAAWRISGKSNYFCVRLKTRPKPETGSQGLTT